MSDTESILRAGSPLDLRFSEDELEARREHIEQFIVEQLEAAGADRAVLGLSGGIDSTLTAYLAVAAVGPERVHALVMPGEVNDPESTSDAERVAETLGVEYDVVDIAPIVSAFLAAYPEAADDRVAAGNVRVRTRAVLAYLVANHEDALVLGTGNRSEAATGYFTKYGDGAVDCYPIGNLYKAQVRQLARHVGVDADLVDKTASAEMWSGQTDEAELGVGYDALDSILVLHVDGPLPRSATVRLLDVDGTAVDRVVELHEGSEHKRRVPPTPDPLGP